MKNYTIDNPEFSSNITICETTDTNHADNINAAPIQLLQNTLSNRAIIARLVKYTYDSTNGRIINLLPFDYDNGTLSVPDGMGHFEGDTLVLTDLI